MDENRVTINEIITNILEEMRNSGYTEASLWMHYVRRFRQITAYHRRKGLLYYDPAVTDEFLSLQRERVDRREIQIHTYYQLRSISHRLNEYYLTGKLHIHAAKHGTTYVLSSHNERLVDQFVDQKRYSPNTAQDVLWITRRYLHYFEKKGKASLAEVSIDEVRQFIIETAGEVRTSSLHNILLYLKHFHIYLKEQGIPAPDCTELFSYTVYREMPVQSYVTDHELERIISVIDTQTTAGKRDYAIIVLAATTGMRACDNIRLKLTDIDWCKGEIRIIQKKTGKPVCMPLIKDAGLAVQDYILNARPASNCKEVFLREATPKIAIADAASIGDMFRRYQKKAGIARQALDGKGFHGLRRRLAKKLLVSGSPLLTVSQILGHDGIDSARQYLSLNTDNLKECALDFSGIEIGGVRS